MTRINYKRQTAVLFEYLEELAKVGSRFLDTAGVPWNEPDAAALRDELSLISSAGGPLHDVQLQALAAEYKRDRKGTV